jgi:hypothetical protein
MTNMNTRLISRAVPSLLVIALLALAAAAPAPPAAGPAPPPQLQPPCTEFASAVAGDSVWSIASWTGIEQVLPEGMSVASCSLRVVMLPTYASPANLMLREWDPTTLAPDPSAIALRRLFVDGSNLGWLGGKVPALPLVPPVVTKSIPGVAEPPKNTVAMQFATSRWTPPAKGYFTPDGPSALPAATWIDTGGVRTPLPGPHPVLAHAVCAGDTDLASLRVVQGVSRLDVKPFPAPKEFAQRFRVAQQTELRWIELALAEVFFPYFQQVGEETRFFGFSPPVLEVIDGDAMASPSTDMPPPLVEARIQNFSQMTWVSHLDFDRTVTLEPGHDYWIYVHDAAATTFFNRRIRGDEPPLFGFGVGPYFARAEAGGDWVQAADQVLAFRIVGRPTAPALPITLSGPHVASAFALSATPNPASGRVRVSWSGAVGPVRFEVIDARGRRVSEGSGGAAGVWSWPGTDREGRAVASGVYFVRARDSAGQYSNQRVMIVR